MAALLTSVKNDKDKMAVYLNECRRMKIQVLPPDVNESSANFTAVGNDIRFGLTAVRNVGSNVVEQIIEARTEMGRFDDFNDFLDKVSAMVCNKRLIESLIRAGAFDSMGHFRRALIAIHEQAVERFGGLKKDDEDQFSIFDGLDDGGPALDVAVTVPDLPEWDKSTLLAHERDMLGLYVSDHPLLGLDHVLATIADSTIGTLLADEERKDGDTVTIAGLVTAVQRKLTKRGDPWALVTVEDLEGAVDVLMFPKAYTLAAGLLREDAVLTIKGRISKSKEQLELHGLEVSAPDLRSAEGGPVQISIPTTRCTPAVVADLGEILRSHPGTTEVRLLLKSRASTKVLRLADQLRVTSTPALIADLKHLLGPGCVE
jgi:DNA polymerase-3 subunit alpha